MAARETIGDLIFLLNRLDEQIRIELDLVGHRMSVLAVSQSFLFTAFTTDLLIADRFGRFRTILLWAIPLLGIAICLIIGFALSAAMYVSHVRKVEREVCRDRLREELEESSLRPDVFRGKKIEILAHVAPRSIPDKFGNYPPLLLVPAIAICWIVLVGALLIRGTQPGS